MCRTGVVVTVLGGLGQGAESTGAAAAAPWPWWPILAAGLGLLAAGGWLTSKKGRKR